MIGAPGGRKPSRFFGGNAMISMREDLRGRYCIPDAREGVDVWYSEQELERGEHLSTCDTTGNVTARLVDGRIAVLYSIDLD